MLRLKVWILLIESVPVGDVTPENGRVDIAQRFAVAAGIIVTRHLHGPVVVYSPSVLSKCQPG